LETAAEVLEVDVGGGALDVESEGMSELVLGGGLPSSQSSVRHTHGPLSERETAHPLSCLLTRPLTGPASTDPKNERTKTKRK